MDFEGEPGSDVGNGLPDEHTDESPTVADAAATDAQQQPSPPPAGPDTAADDQQSADSADTSPATADPAVEAHHEDGDAAWPAADLVGTVPAEETAEETADPGDDSDAPIELGDASPAAPGALPEHVRGETVNLKQGGVQTIDASTVTITQGGAGRVNSDTMTLDQSGVAIARTNTLTLGSGASAFAIVANQATVEKGANAFILVSRSFEGDVQPTIDWRTALGFGAGLGLVLAIIRRLR